MYHLSPTHRKRLAEQLRANGAVRVRGASRVNPEKAKEMLRHGTVHGHALTKRQKGLFGLIAGGGRPTRTRQ